jgi:dCTP deaminase
MRPSRPRSISGATIAADLPVSALLFQAQALIERLDAFTDSDYPQQTMTIVALLRLLAKRALHELIRLDEKTKRRLTPAESAQARDLGSIVHVLHSYLRYLQASDPLRSPPGVQQAISLLVAAHGKAALKCESSHINVLVRPQWTYNLKYIDLIHQFQADAECDLAFALDPDGLLGAHDARTLVEKLWEQRQPGCSAPRHVAVLSFAGLDRDDVLLYPLLAHELGHFLDFASDDIGGSSTDSAIVAYLPNTKQISAAGVRVDRHSAFVELIRVCLREITADLLAARMVGLGYFFAFAEFFKTLTPWPGPLINPESGYPGFGLRLQLIWQELESPDAGIETTVAMREMLARWKLIGKSRLQEYMAYWKGRVQSLQTSLPTNQSVVLMQETVNRAIPAIKQLAREIIPSSNAAMLPEDIEDMVGLLEDRIPPFQPPTRKQRQESSYSSWAFHEILTAGWLYQIAIGEGRERQQQESWARYREYQNTCLLILKALELDGANTAIQQIQKRNRHSDQVSKGGVSGRAVGRGVISGPSLRLALDRPSRLKRLVVCPDFGDGPIESASRDLHLGHWFRVSRRTSLAKVDISYAEDRARARQQGQAEVFVAAGGEFILQPGDFALAVSMEYVCLPPDIMAFVEGKSSLGRAGLLIATATQVAPGFKGCIVLELYNAGTVPVILRPAMRVAQLIFVSTDHDVPAKWLYAGAFQVQIRP